VVMCWNESVAIHDATIVPNVEKGTKGATGHSGSIYQFDVDQRPRARWRMEKLVRVCLAGPEAQRRYSPRSWRNYHGSEDLHAAVGVLSYFCGSNEEIEAYLRLLEIQTGQILGQPLIWNAVEAVAEALLESHQLDRRKLRAVIQESFASTFPPLPESPLARPAKSK